MNNDQAVPMRHTIPDLSSYYGEKMMTNCYLLRRPADALFQPLSGEPDFDLLLWMLGGCGEPGELGLRRVGELVERRDEGQVVVQRRVVFGRVEGHCDLGHLGRIKSAETLG